MARTRTPFIPADDFGPPPAAPPGIGRQTYPAMGPPPLLGPPTPIGWFDHGAHQAPPMPAAVPTAAYGPAPAGNDGQAVDDFIAQLLGSLNVNAPQVPQPQAPDYATLLAPYAQARDAANKSAVAGRGVIGDATTQATNTINQLRDQYAALQQQQTQQQAADAQHQQASLSSALSPIMGALNAQGVDAGPLNQQAAALQGVLQTGAGAAQQLAAQRAIQTQSDMGGRQQDTQLIKDSALGTLQNNLDSALQKIGLGESQAHNAYAQQYEAAKRQAAAQQWSMDQQAAQENRATSRSINQFINQLRTKGPDGKAIAQGMLDDYASKSPAGYNSRAIATFNNIVNGNSDAGIAKPASLAEALSRVNDAAKQQRLDPNVLRTWIQAYYTPKSTGLPPDWRDQLAEYVAAIQ